jgi:2-dehydro-3-deoxyphosphogluconate aldolase/(4S)-4-hydroxy-2-oxoglutarate aldolase
MNKTLKLIEQERIIGIIGTETTDQALGVVDAMAAGGLKAIEVLCGTPDYVKVIKRIKTHKGVVAGAGTVTDMERAEAVVKAGADFVIAPNTDEEIIAYAKEHGRVVIPGAATPTEIYRAWRLGADVVKVFPISSLGGSEYIGKIKGLHKDVRLMPTGNVAIEEIDEYLRAGVFCVGVGPAIVDGRALEDGDYERIADRTRSALVRARSI